MEDVTDGAGQGVVDPVQHQELEVTSLERVQTSPLNMSSLHLAAAKGDVDILRALILRVDHVVDLSVMDDLNRTPLHLAAYNNHAEVVKVILSNLERIQVDVNAPAMFGITPLHLSIMRRSVSVAEVLISFPLVDKMAESEEHSNVLHMAADVGQDNIVTLLGKTLSEAEIGKLMSTAMADKIQRTPLHYAARAGHVDVVKLFLQQPFYEYVDVNAKDVDGLTPLHLAARMGHTGVVSELLNCSNLSVNAKVRNDNNTQGTLVAPTDLELEYLPRPSLADAYTETSNGFTALHLAAREGHKGVVVTLLRSSSVLVNEVDVDGLTPLHYACMNGQAEVVQVLLNHPKRNVNAEAKDKSTPLHLGVKGGHIPTVIELLRQADINCNCEDSTGATPLDIAEREGHINLVWLLLEHPVEVREEPDAEHLYSKQLDLATQERQTEIVWLLFQRVADEVAFPEGDSRNQHLLHWAAQMGYKQLTVHLLEWGTSSRDVNIRDNLLNTPLHYAAQKGHVEVVRTLLAQPGLDINAENFQKETPLHMAAKEGQTEVVRELSLETSGRLRATEEDRFDRTALQLAVENHHKDIQKLLLERSDVQEYVNGLYRDRQVYVDGTNAILVGSSLIASITFAAWLQPPFGYAPYVGGAPGAAQPTGNYEVYVDVQQHPNLQIFWIFNSLSFFFSIATILAGAGGVLPMREGFIKDAVVKVRSALTWTAFLLAGSVIFVLGAFTTAGYIVLPPILKYRNNMIITIVFGISVCAIALVVFLRDLYQLLPERWRNSTDNDVCSSGVKRSWRARRM